jgi:hypothetical protein
MKSIQLNALITVGLVLTISACQSAQQPSQQQAQASGAAPSAQAPSNQSSGALCDNPYIPVVESATWTSNVSFGQLSTAQEDTITDVGTDAFLVETKAAGTSVVVTWTCTADGVLWLQTDGGMFSAVSQDATWSTNSFSGVTIPKEIQPGDTWSSSQEMTASDANGNSQTFTINANYQAVGIESVSVPAGTFDAMRIDFVMTFTGADAESSFEFSDWFVENVGLVKSAAQQITGGSLSFSQELASYSIP